MSKRMFEETKIDEEIKKVKEAQKKLKETKTSDYDPKSNTITLSNELLMNGVESCIGPKIGRRLAIRLRDHLLKLMKKEHDKVKEERFATRLKESLTEEQQTIPDFLLKDNGFNQIFRDERVQKEAKQRILMNDTSPNLERYMEKRKQEAMKISFGIPKFIDMFMPDICLNLAEEYLNYHLGFTKEDTVESVDREEDEKVERFKALINNVVESTED